MSTPTQTHAANATATASAMASAAGATASNALKATTSAVKTGASQAKTTTQHTIEQLAMNAKTNATEIASKVAEMAKNGNWQEAPEKVQRLLTGRSEASLILLALEYFFVRASRRDNELRASGSSLFGKILLAANGYNLVVFALKDKAPAVWKAAANIELKGADAEALGSLTLTALAIPGALACASAIAGPDKHPLSVLGLAATKLFLGVFFAMRGDVAKVAGNASVSDLAKYHARTGLALLLYGILLLWRGRATTNTPRYAVEMERRLVERLDQLIVVVKDQKSRLDELNGAAPSTPKKY